MDFIAMKKQQVDEEHQDQDPSEGADDGGAGWGVQANREIDPQGGDQGAHGPANGEPGADAVGKQHSADGGNDQVAEHQQHAGDRHGRGHDETEGSVKKEVPEPDVDSLPLGLGGVGRNQEKFVPENVMEDADGTVEQGSFPDLSPGNGQDVADQHVLEVLGLAGGLTHGQDGCGGRNCVSDPDKGFLGNVAAPGTSQSKDGGSQERESEAEEVGAASVRVHAHQDCDSRAQGSDLRQGEVHKNHAAFDHVHTQIGMNAGQDQAGHKRPNQKRKNLHGSPRAYCVD